MAWLYAKDTNKPLWSLILAKTGSISWLRGQLAGLCDCESSGHRLAGIEHLGPT